MTLPTGNFERRSRPREQTTHQKVPGWFSNTAEMFLRTFPGLTEIDLETLALFSPRKRLLDTLRKYITTWLEQQKKLGRHIGVRISKKRIREPRKASNVEGDESEDEENEENEENEKENEENGKENEEERRNSEEQGADDEAGEPRRKKQKHTNRKKRLTKSQKKREGDQEEDQEHINADGADAVEDREDHGEPNSAPGNQHGEDRSSLEKLMHQSVAVHAHLTPREVINLASSSQTSYSLLKSFLPKKPQTDSTPKINRDEELARALQDDFFAQNDGIGASGVPEWDGADFRAEEGAAATNDKGHPPPHTSRDKQPSHGEEGDEIVELAGLLFEEKEGRKADRARDGGYIADLQGQAERLRGQLITSKGENHRLCILLREKNKEIQERKEVCEETKKLLTTRGVLEQVDHGRKLLQEAEERAAKIARELEEEREAKREAGEKVEHGQKLLQEAEGRAAKIARELEEEREAKRVSEEKVEHGQKLLQEAEERAAKIARELEEEREAKREAEEKYAQTAETKWRERERLAAQIVVTEKLEAEEKTGEAAVKLDNARAENEEYKKALDAAREKVQHLTQQSIRQEEEKKNLANEVANVRLANQTIEDSARNMRVELNEEIECRKKGDVSKELVDNELGILRAELAAANEAKQLAEQQRDAAWQDLNQAQQDLVEVHKKADQAELRPHLCGYKYLHDENDKMSFLTVQQASEVLKAQEELNKVRAARVKETWQSEFLLDENNRLKAEIAILKKIEKEGFSAEEVKARLAEIQRRQDDREPGSGQQ